MSEENNEHVYIYIFGIIGMLGIYYTCCKRQLNTLSNTNQPEIAIIIEEDTSINVPFAIVAD